MTKHSCQIGHGGPLAQTPVAYVYAVFGCGCHISTCTACFIGLRRLVDTHPRVTTECPVCRKVIIVSEVTYV